MRESEKEIYKLIADKKIVGMDIDEACVTIYVAGGNSITVFIDYNDATLKMTGNKLFKKATFGMRG